MWDDIAILARYLLMLSFNNCLDVARHLPFLFHIITFLVCTGPVSMRASTHGLVINIIHSLCTCTKPTFLGKFGCVLGVFWGVLGVFGCVWMCLSVFWGVWDVFGGVWVCIRVCLYVCVCACVL